MRRQSRRPPHLRRQLPNAPSHLRLFPRPRSRPRPPDPRPRQATTTAMISRARKKPNSTSRQETPTASMRTATEWLVRPYLRGCEGPLALVHIPSLSGAPLPRGAASQDGGPDRHRHTPPALSQPTPGRRSLVAPLAPGDIPAWAAEVASRSRVRHLFAGAAL